MKDTKSDVGEARSHNIGYFYAKNGGKGEMIMMDRKITPASSSSRQFEHNSAYESQHQPSETSPSEILSLTELIDIALYTVQKINSYPASLGKTVDNYFDLLFPDEIKAYLIKRSINTKTLSNLGFRCVKSKSLEIHPTSPYADKAEMVRDIRALCQCFVEQQDSILQLISDKLDELETGLSDMNVDKGGNADDK